MFTQELFVSIGNYYLHRKLERGRGVERERKREREREKEREREREREMHTRTNAYTHIRTHTQTHTLTFGGGYRPGSHGGSKPALKLSFDKPEPHRGHCSPIDGVLAI